jgi:hypothetical protein
MKQALRVLFLAAAALLASSCGAVRFQNAWGDYDPRYERSALEGRWRGEWRSDQNGHAGGLRCLMTREDGAHCHAWFYATYAALLFFQHQVDFHVRDTGDGTLHFTGQQDLGQAFGGLYRYEGTVTGDTFRATYQAANGDHGVFELERVD